MIHIGYLDCVWREGNALYGSVRSTNPMPYKEFQVRGHLDLNGFTYPDQGHYRLRDLVLGPSTEDCLWSEWTVQTDLQKIGLFKVIGYGIWRPHDLDCLERQVAEMNKQGLNFSVRALVGQEICCEEHS